jgi:hypothetical protein
MLFLLRLAFWILVVCLLLPGSGDDKRRLVNSAERTVSDMRGFCQRNPDVCDDARVTMTSLLSKLRSGAELLQTWLAESGPEAAGAPQVKPAPAGGQPAAQTPLPPPRLVPRWQDSLNPADKQMPWRGPAHL